MSDSKKTLIIGLGNTILTDDGAGIYAVREIRRRINGNYGHTEVAESEVAGFALLDLMTGWDKVILIDAIAFDNVLPGTVVKIQPDDLKTSLRIRSVHEIDLPTLLKLGQQLDIPMPHEISIFGIQAEDMSTFGENLTPRVAESIEKVVTLVLEELKI